LTRSAAGLRVATVTDDAKKEGALVYEDRVLAYVDVLGWRKLVKESEKDFSVMKTVTEAVESLKRAEQGIRELRDFAGDQRALMPEVTVFSDTVVASCPPNRIAIDLLVGQLQLFSTELMLHGLYTRGALVRGPLVHTDGVILGPALVDAYELETSVAKYPRILVTDTLRGGAIADLMGQAVVSENDVLEDQDSFAILNIFRGPLGPLDPRYLEALLARVESDFSEHHDDAGIRAKLGWLLRAVQSALDEARRSAPTLG
jgi:hypothetical protein